jgi:hypothetical protein
LANYDEQGKWTACRKNTLRKDNPIWEKETEMTAVVIEIERR